MNFEVSNDRSINVSSNEESSLSYGIQISGYGLDVTENTFSIELQFNTPST